MCKHTQAVGVDGIGGHTAGGEEEEEAAAQVPAAPDAKGEWSSTFYLLCDVIGVMTQLMFISRVISYHSCDAIAQGGKSVELCRGSRKWCALHIDTGMYGEQ